MVAISENYARDQIDTRLPDGASFRFLLRNLLKESPFTSILWSSIASQIISSTLNLDANRVARNDGYEIVGLRFIIDIARTFFTHRVVKE